MEVSPCIHIQLQRFKSCILPQTYCALSLILLNNLSFNLDILYIIYMTRIIPMTRHYMHKFASLDYVICNHGGRQAHTGGAWSW